MAMLTEKNAAGISIKPQVRPEPFPPLVVLV
jgi:hypothetical protein